MKSRFALLVWGLLLLGPDLWAQDPSFSQFYAHRNYLNPALTALDPGLSVSAISRMQWLRADGGFRTYGASVEIQEPFIRSGFGLSFFQDTEGIGRLATTSVGLSYAYTIPGRKSNLHFGFSSRWVQKSLDWSKFIFSDQLDPVLGPVYGTAASPGLEYLSFFDVDFGMVWRFDSRFSLGKGRAVSDARSMIGLSVHHLPGLFGSPQLQESFQNLSTVVPPRITFHMGTIIPTTIFKGAGRELSISPNFKFDIQGNNPFNFGQSLKVFSLGSYLLYEGFYVGAFYQDKLPFPSGAKNTNAFTLMLGGYMGRGRGPEDDQQFFLGLSVDINTTGLGVSGGNVYELAMRVNFSEFPSLFGSNRSRSSQKLLDCKSFF